MKEALKAVRASRPFNGPATVVTRAVSRLTGHEFETAIKHLPRTGPVRSTLPNGQVLRLWSRGDDWVSNQVFWRGWSGYEPETTPLFFHLAQEADVVVDVGAFVGLYSLLAALANPRGRVFAFEPMPDNAERFRRHIELNRLKNVELVPAAVSAESGTAELFHLGGSYPSSTSLVEGFMSSHPDVRASVVPTVALDAFLDERGADHVSLVKLDIETGEPEALLGMSRTLERDRPAIFCEVLSADVGARLQTILAPLGYRYYHLTPEGPLEREEILCHPEWLNYLFALSRPELP
jgi:FkbM family methyltransferase